MGAHLAFIWDRIRNSYWFVPSLMAGAAVALAVAAAAADHAAGPPGTILREAWWVYRGGTDGAREVLSTIAGSMITVTGVVFSVTIVALQLASSQFGPRVLVSFMRDRSTQVVLGTFVATFLYSLLLLQTIRSQGAAEPAPAPRVSIAIGVALAVLSLGVLIYFIHHVAISIQAPHLVNALARELHTGIQQLFPEAGQEPDDPAPHRHALDRPTTGATPIPASRNGYLGAVDLDRLVQLAAEHDLVLRLEHRPGHFVTRGDPLAYVWSADRAEGKLYERLTRQFVVGPTRTHIQDVEFTINQLVEVAVRSLSPGINDPFTAVNCVDELAAALGHIASRTIPSPARLDSQGRLRAIIARPLTFAGLADTALNQIRQNAAHHTAVYLRLLETLGRTLPCARTPQQRQTLLRHADLIRRCALDHIPDASDRADLEQRYQETVAANRPERMPAASRVVSRERGPGSSGRV